MFFCFKDLVRSLISSESVIDDIVNQYYEDGQKLMTTMETIHMNQYQEFTVQMRREAIRLTKGIKATVQKLELRQNRIQEKTMSAIQNWVQETDDLKAKVARLEKGLI
jgi:hypothetical protein